MIPPESMLDDEAFCFHAFSLAASGWTVLPAQIDADGLERLRAACDRAVAGLQRHRAAGLPIAHYSGSDHYLAARAMYCWDAACRELIEHPTVAAFAQRVMGAHRLWDLSAMYALPVPADRQDATTCWHRDFAAGDGGPAYLWFFLCLDDVGRDNGATWVVPGSHHAAVIGAPQPALPPTWSGDALLESFPTGMPVRARAGDILVLDPITLHSSGRNITSSPRRLLNIGLCRQDRKPLFDHWSLAGEDIQRGASGRLRGLLDAGPLGLDQTWSVLPEGWRTARRASDVEAVPTSDLSLALVHA
jgi:ectoine hydroxylase-related dioxygenase (phytanoyl-CoA dioxygenase family)